MGFQVNTQREFTVKHNLVVETKEIKEDVENGIKAVPYSKEEYPLEVTFRHLAGEDTDFGELRLKLEGVSDIKVINEETGEAMDNNSYNVFLYTLRKGLVDCKGFTDQNGKDLVITDDSGKINPDIQLVVFEAVRQISDFFNKVVSAYTGTNSKN